MDQPFFQETLVGILQRAVLGHVLFLDRGNLGIQLASQRVGEGRADVHVVVVSLVLGGRDHRRMDLGDQCRALALVAVAQIVLGRAMVLGGRAAGNDVGVALQNVVGILAFETVEHRRVAIEMIEVFQQSESVGLRLIGIRLVLRHGSGHFDGDLFIGHRGFQRRVVSR